MKTPPVKTIATESLRASCTIQLLDDDSVAITGTIHTHMPKEIKPLSRNFISCQANFYHLVEDLILCDKVTIWKFIGLMWTRPLGTFQSLCIWNQNTAIWMQQNYFMWNGSSGLRGVDIMWLEIKPQRINNGLMLILYRYIFTRFLKSSHFIPHFTMDMITQLCWDKT